jgi:hypothetical protein
MNVLTAVVMKSPIFRGITPCSPLKANGCFAGTCRLHLQDQRISKAKKPALLAATCFMVFSCMSYFLILKMETTYSSETSVEFSTTTRRYISEDRTLQPTFNFGRKPERK